MNKEYKAESEEVSSNNVCVACETGKGEHTHESMDKKHENKCESCGHEHKEDGKCDCGCGM